MFAAVLAYLRFLRGLPLSWKLASPPCGVAGTLPPRLSDDPPAGVEVPGTNPAPGFAARRYVGRPVAGFDLREERDA